MWHLIANKIRVRALIGNFCSNLWVGLTTVFLRRINFSSFIKKKLVCTVFVHSNFSFRHHAHLRAKQLEMRRQH
jgi:hypothetical protein